MLNRLSPKERKFLRARNRADDDDDARVTAQDRPVSRPVQAKCARARVAWCWGGVPNQTQRVRFPPPAPSVKDGVAEWIGTDLAKADHAGSNPVPVSNGIHVSITEIVTEL